MTPTRVMVTGNAGSGKTTLASTLGGTLRIPVYGLDEIVWAPGWRKTPPHEKGAALAELAQKPAWIIDGVSSLIEEAADLVVFLDERPSVCIWRCTKRNRRYLFRSRPGLPANCPELRIIPRLFRLIWRFNTDVRPGIVDRMVANPRRYRRVTSRDDYATLLSELTRQSI